MVTSVLSTIARTIVASVIWELRVLRGSLPLALTSLERNPWTTVLAVDASEWGK